MRLFPLLALVCLLALPAAALGQERQTRVVHGDAAAPGQYRWTVALVSAGATAYDGQFCAGTLLGATTVVTAAHCTISSAPGEIEVVAGVTTLSLATEESYYGVDSVSLHPDAEVDDEAGSETRSDVSVLTLSRPVEDPAAIEPMTGAAFDALPAGEPLQIVGWGADESGLAHDTLQQTTVERWSDDDCERFYGPEAVAGDTIFCALRVDAGDPDDPDDDLVYDTCTGDSGGPIATVGDDPLVADDSWKLLGAVSYGSPGCLDGEWPGAYARIAGPLHDYVTAPAHLAQPTRIGPGRPVLTGDATATSTLTCSKGAAAFSPGATTRMMIRRPAGDFQYETVASADADSVTYPLTRADLGRRYLCEARGVVEGAGGYASVRSPLSASVRAPIVVVEEEEQLPPAPPPEPQPQPQPEPVPPPPPVVVPADVAAPRVTRVTRRCRRRRCTLTVRASDPLPSAGVTALRVTLRSTTRRSCVRRGRLTTCTRTRTRWLVARRRTDGIFTVRTGRLPPGRHVAAIVAIDGAGNRQVRPFRAPFRLR